MTTVNPVDTKVGNESGIGQYFPATYLPPYGTTLAPEAFTYLEQAPHSTAETEANNGFWHTTVTDRHGETFTYTLSNPSHLNGDCTLWENGKEVYPADVSTKELRKLPLPQTYDWILRQDANRNLADSQPQWNGQDIEAVLRRIEYNVSTYSRSEENLKNFGGLDDFQTWIDSQLEGTTVKAHAFEIGEFQKIDANKKWRKKTNMLQTLIRHWHPEVECHLEAEPDPNGIQNVPAYVYVTTKMGSDDFYSQGGCSHSVISPVVSIIHDGALLTRYEATFAVDIKELEKHATIYRAKDCAPPTNNQSGNYAHGHRIWWGIEFPELGLAMVFPKIGTNLLINTESDGAEVQFHAEETMRRTQINYLVDRFGRKWGKWIDPDSNMTQAELDQGVADAETLLAGLEHGPELTRRILDQWQATHNAIEKPVIVDHGTGTFMVIKDDRVVVLNSMDWPQGHYAYRDQMLVFLPDGAADNVDSDTLWAKHAPFNQKGTAAQMEALERYNQERYANYGDFAADNLPTSEYIDSWLDTFPDGTNFVFLNHIANQYSTVSRSRDWYTATYRLMESNRLAEILNAWWDREVDGADEIASPDFSNEVLRVAQALTPPALPGAVESSGIAKGALVK